MRSRSGLARHAKTLYAIAKDAVGLSDALAASPALASSNITLQALLSECPNLDSYALPPVVWPHIEHMNKESAHLSALRENAQRLGIEDQGRVEKLRSETSKTPEDTMDTLKPDAHELTASHPVRFGLSLDLINYFSGIIKQLAEEQALTEANQDFLESLYFSKIKTRRRKIETAHAKTFRWIFQPSISFNHWLREGSGTFWVQGKAGSGKSTLMKFICSHPMTMKSLQEWAGSKRLVTAEFFYWSAGTVLQKSREGLLRSLLFEILRKCPELIPRVTKGHNEASLRRRGPYPYIDEEELWSQEDLMVAYRSLYMIDSVSPIYVPQMVRTLWLATSAPEPQFLMVYSLLDDASDDIAAFTDGYSLKLMHDEEVRMRAQQMRRRIDGRCKGLLEVVTDDPNVGLYFECKVDFLHRTVRDFLLGSPEIRQILDQQRFADLSGIGHCASNVWLLPCLSILEAFKRAPFNTDPRVTTAADTGIVRRLLESGIARRLLEGLMIFAHEAEVNMTDRSALVRILCDAEETYYRKKQQFAWSLENYLFLGLACQAGLFSYIRNRITGAMGADPNEPVIPSRDDTSSWCRFLRDVSASAHLRKDERVRETIRLLLRHGANPLCPRCVQKGLTRVSIGVVPARHPVVPIAGDNGRAEQVDHLVVTLLMLTVA
ncbi:hypothetical protein F4860DRAFT_500765 [Xylaria cubensis]|nr:hypothetical protein F4860DRAFT_500765 [Xylaria cubensis]